MRIGSRCRNEEAACSTTTIPGDIHMFKFLAKRPIMALALAGAFAAIPAQAAEEPIKIGAIYIMSGSAATYGKFAEQGITLAMDEINASGGEIGRASWRERVCQYVSIWVVGVSLKKQKTNKLR